MHDDIEQSLSDAGLELKPNEMDDGDVYRALAEYFAVVCLKDQEETRIGSP